MPAQVTNYKCPACTGPLHFASGSGKMECEYCGSVYDIAEIEAMYSADNASAEAAGQAAEEKEAARQKQAAAEGWDFSDMSEDWGEDGKGMTAYTCPSCGAELICDETTIATSCPYCDNPTVVPKQFGGTLKPDLIIPFRLDKEAAKDALRRHTRGKKLLPKAFSSENHLDEIKGVYVPFWLYDAASSGTVTYEATRTSSWSDKDYNYAKTEYWHVVRSGSMLFDAIPADGSSKMDDDLMDSIEPFDISEAVDFRSAYLSGYLADKYDVTAEDNLPRANNRVSNSTIEVLRGTVGAYTTLNEQSRNVHIKNGKARYALYPVWIMNTSWNGEKYTFAMNGQTGKIVGDMPMDKKAYWLWKLISTVGIGAVVFLFLTITGLI